MLTRQTYAFGYKTSEAAYDALHDMISEGEISHCEMPEVASYKAGPKDCEGKRHLPRYKITVLN